MPFLTKGKTNWKYILIVVIFATIVGGGILVYLRYFNKEISSLAKFSEIKKTEKPKIEEGITNWKTYRNEEYGFEIKYPENWYVYPTNPFGIELEKNVIVFFNLSEKQIEMLSEKIERGEKPEEIKNVYSFKIKKIQKTVDEFRKENRAIAEKFGVKILEEKISINNFNGYKIISEIREDGKFLSFLLYKGGNTYLIETPYPQECQSDWVDEKCKVFNQMLSTFRFLE